MPVDYALRAARARQTALLGYEYKKPTHEPKPPRMTKAERVAALAAAREAKRKHEEQVLWLIAQKIMGAISNCIPDGDPIDHIAPYVRRHTACNEWDVMKWLNRACRKHLDCRSYDQYLIDAWDGWNEVCEPDQRMTNPWRPVK